MTPFSKWAKPGECVREEQRGTDNCFVPNFWCKRESYLDPALPRASDVSDRKVLPANLLPERDQQRPSRDRALKERIDEIEKGIVIHEGNEYHFPALPPELLAILADGGLIPHVRKELGKD